MIKKCTDYNEYMREYVRRRYLLLKMKAVNYKGGKCVKCGYKVCLAALTFHHRDPKLKEMNWNQLRRRSWESIVKELDKCDLLCHNCHAEAHYDSAILFEAVEWMGDKKRTIFKGQIRKCDHCGSTFVMKNGDDRHRKYCSPRCSQFANVKGRWPTNSKLIKLSKSLGMVQVAKTVGVSARAVKKRLDRIRDGLPVSGERHGIPDDGANEV